MPPLNYEPTAADLADGLLTPFADPDWSPTLLELNLQDVARRQLNPEGLVALAAARARLADLHAAAAAMDAAAAALAARLSD